MDARGSLDGESDISSEDGDSPGMPQSAHELDRTPSERHSFLFRLNLNPSHPDLRDLRPLPSQIPFLLSVYSENVQVFFHILHMPTVTKIVHDMRDSNAASLTPANEALLFSIYYAAVTSMEEDDVSPALFELLSPGNHYLRLLDHNQLWLYEIGTLSQIPSRPGACSSQGRLS